MTLERTLQESVNADLRRMGIKHYHIEKGRANRSRQHRKGIPDLMIFPGEGNVWFVELKSKTGKLRPEQEDFRLWCEQMHYDFFVVSSWAEWEMVKTDKGLK